MTALIIAMLLSLPGLSAVADFPAGGVTYFPHTTFAESSLQSLSSGCKDWVSLLALNTKQGKGSKPQSVEDTTYDSCSEMYKEAVQYESPYVNETQMAFDTLEKFIKCCPFNENTPSAFGMLNQAAGAIMPLDTFAYLAYRQWLEAVLYLNTVNPEYFCQCLEAIAKTFYSNSDTGRAYYLVGPNSGLALIQWLILNTTCDTPNLATEYRNTRYNQYIFWAEDSTAGPLDTTLPTMRQLGLDTLLARHKLAVVPNQPVSIILSATASPNPVSTGTIITFGLNQEAYVKINLFDILGKAVSGDRVPGSGGEGFEGLFEAGNYEVPLSLQGIPSGTYFARILTAYGNVATVKLVKQ